MKLKKGRCNVLYLGSGNPVPQEMLGVARLESSSWVQGCKDVSGTGASVVGGEAESWDSLA